MNSNNFFLSKYFPTLSNREEFYNRLTEEKKISSTIIGQYLMLALFTYTYGFSMGIYHSLLQAVTAGVKVVVLFTLVLLICFPAFYIIQYILGSKLRLGQMISIILSGFILSGAIMISLLPIVIIFLLTGSNYYFLQLLHIGVFIFAGIFGMITIVDALKYSCEKKAVYPHTGVIVFRFWVVILAFVGIQLAWNFRPFLGDRGQPYELFREYEGNFYTALVYSFKQLVASDQGGASKEQYDTYYDDSSTQDSLMNAYRHKDGADGN